MEIVTKGLAAVTPQHRGKTIRAFRVIPVVLLFALMLSVTFTSAYAVSENVGDRFNDSPGTPLPLHILNADPIGGGWIQSIGADFRITPDGRSAHEASLTGESRIATIDTLVSEYDLEVDLTRSSAASVLGLVFRYVDDTNYFAVTDDGDWLKLLVISDGVKSVLDRWRLKAWAEPLSPGTVQIRHDGITVTLRGQNILSTDNSSFSDATVAGLIFRSTQTTGFRNFSVELGNYVDDEPSPEPAEPHVLDSFTAADGTPLVSHTGTEQTSGGSWATLRGDWEITGESAKLSVPDPALAHADQIAIIPAHGPTDQEISADVTWFGGTVGVAWNATDVDNYSLSFWDGSYIVVGRIEDGRFRELGRQRALWNPGETRNLRIQINGSKARFYLDDTEPLMLAMGLTAPTILNGGMFVRNGANNRFDNFAIRESAQLAQPDPSLTDDPPFTPGTTVPPQDAWVFDSFDSPNYTLLQHRTPEQDPAGDGWTQVSGLWQIWQAHASEQSGVFGPEILDRFAVVDTGTDQPDLEATVDLDGGRVGVMFGGRATGPEDAGRNGFLFFRNGERLEVGRLIGGTYFRIASSDDFRWRAGQSKQMSVKVVEDRAKLWLNGSKIFDFRDPALEYSTWAGLFQRGRNDERFNNFTVTLPEGVEPPSAPAIGPISDIDMKIFETVVVPVPVEGPGSFKPEISATVTRIPEGPVVFDSFTGSTGESGQRLSEHTPDIAPGGAVWIQVRPGAESVVVNGVLKMSIGGDGGDQRVVIDAGVSNVEVSADLTSLGGRLGLVARHDGSTTDANWLMAWVDSESSLLFMGMNLDGEFRLLRVMPYAWPSLETRMMSLRVDGTDAVLSIDGIELLTATVPVELSGTHYGLFSLDFNGVGLFDNFSVVALDLPEFISIEDNSTSEPKLRVTPSASDIGTYRLVLETEHSGDVLNTSFLLNVLPPDGPTAHAGGPYSIAAGETVSLNGTGSSAGDSAIVSYDWDVDGDGLADLNGSSVLIEPLASGEYEIALTVTDENGLTSQSDTNLTVISQLPEVPLSDMVLVRDAVLNEGALVLTPDANWRIGAAWTPAPVEITSGFTAEFSFQVTAANDPRADGLVFVLQASPDGTGAIGRAGDGIGYSSIENSLAIEFDTWVNSGFGEIGPHVAVHSDGSAPNASSGSTRIGSIELPSLLTGAVMRVRIEYVPGTLKIFVEDFSQPTLEIPVDLAALLDLPAGEAFAGFTASTGGASQENTVLSFHLSTVS